MRSALIFDLIVVVDALRDPFAAQAIGVDDAAQITAVEYADVGDAEFHHATEGLSYEWVWPLAYGGYPVGEENLSKASGEGKGRADQDLMSDFEAFHSWGLNTLFADLAARPPRGATKMH